jgi:hypothetical protein
MDGGGVGGGAIGRREIAGTAAPVVGAHTDDKNVYLTSLSARPPAVQPECSNSELLRTVNVSKLSDLLATGNAPTAGDVHLGDVYRVGANGDRLAIVPVNLASGHWPTRTTAVKAVSWSTDEEGLSVADRSQVAVAMGGTFGTVALDGSGGVSGSSARRTKSIRFELTQTDHTDSLVPGPDPAGIFGSGVTSEQVRREVSGQFPMYVSSVNYGRYVLISARSDYSEEETEKAVSVALAIGGGRATTGLTLTDVQRTILSSAKV